jgi:amino acid adenylation domain-containing protein
MTCAEFVTELHRLHVRLWLEGGRLRVSAPRGVLNDELRGLLQSRKEELREWMEQQGAPSQPELALRRMERLGGMELSYAQQRLWFLYRLEGASATYNIPVGWRLEGDLDRGALEQAVRDVVGRQEALRTIFPERDGVPFQHVLSPEEAQVRFIYEASSERDLGQRLEEAARTGLELEREIPLRVWLFGLESGEHVLLLLLHHIAGDGWSMGPLLRELGEAYGARLRGEAPGWKELEVQYGDYAIWQRKWLGEEEDAGSRMARQLAFWRKELEGAPEELQLPADRVRPQAASHGGGTVRFGMRRELQEKMMKMGRSCGASLFMVLAAGLSALLYRLGGGEDIVMGTVGAGRGERALEGLVGLFVNTLVLRTDVSGEPGFAELVKRVRGVALEAYAHQDVPFERVVEVLQPGRSLARHPLFQVMLVLQNTPEPELEMRGLQVKAERMEWEVAKFDLTVSLKERWSSGGEPEGLEGELQYSRDLFEAETAESIVRRWVRLLEAGMAQPACAVGRLEILSGEERRQLLEEFNGVRAEVRPQTLVELFEQQVRKAPEAEALRWGERSLSYGELNERANRLAHYLMGEGVGPEKIVGICLERSFEMVVAIVGVEKAGGAYLPLDGEYPRARLEQMLADAAPTVVLTSAGLRSRLPVRAGVRELDSREMQRALEQAPKHNPRDAERSSALRPQHPAYVIYTSGSTGTPKGVMVTHCGIAPLAAALLEGLALTSKSRVLQFASLNFDASVLEMVMAFSTGAVLELLDDPRNLSILVKLLRSGRVTHAILPLAVLSALEQETRPEKLPLDCLIVGGEACPGSIVSRWASNRRMVNMYGPTESTVCSSMTAPLAGNMTPPIGTPIQDSQIFILDRYLEPAPVGVPGELYIAADGLGRGYLNRASLTAERFVANPHGSSGTRVYRTGDIARWRSDGMLEYIGRADQQVKIRGFRIELAEVEAALLRQPQVAQAAVIPRDDPTGGKQLVAYVVSSKGVTVDLAELRQELSEQLPTHMLPSAFVPLDSFPLTVSGKLDRHRLQQLVPPSGEGKSSSSHTAPAGGWESVIADVWRGVLHVPSPGVHDNFFHLGGHSLALAQVHSRLQKQLSWDLPLVKLFEHPTIASLAKYLDQSGEPAIECAAKPCRRRTGDIAIIGMACRFPQAASIEAFWDGLQRGADSITPATSQALEAAPKGLTGDPNFVNAMGRLDGIELFDAALFGLNPLEAIATDPQQRLLMECSWEALESAGYNPEIYGKSIGVFAGAGESHYRALASADPSLQALGAMQLVIGSGKDHIAPRLSYMLNLQGPSVPVNTACSTSLVAVHLACQSLLDGECDIALAGACSIAAVPQIGYLFQEGGILSADGRCRAFDSAAQGTVPGSGAGMVVLKRLEEAIADGDHIHAVVKGTSINNDGSRKVGYAAPSVEGQRQVIREALSAAGVHSAQISYIEAHGTGTPLGDPIEIEALRQVFAEGQRAEKCAVGSVKTNIGHCDAAAGIAGLIKTALCLENRTLVPTLHFEKPNPHLDLDRSPFHVVTETIPWQRTPRFAGVSSFGIGGTNAHVILSEAPARRSTGSSRLWQPFVISAQSEAALERKREELADFLAARPEWVPADVGFTLNVGRKTLPIRQGFAVASREDVISHLRDKEAKSTYVPSNASRSIVFLFPGQGKLHLDSIRGLYRSEKHFRSAVDHCCEHFAPIVSFDFRGWFAEKTTLASAELRRPTRLQPLLFTTEYALAELWMSWGIRPAAMLGHSLGEYVAATLAGVLRLEDSLALVAERSQGTERLVGGAMVAVPMSEADLRPRLNGALSLAAVNSPAWCVVSGPNEEIDRFSAELRDLHPIRLETTHAFHSALMDPLMEPLTRMASRFQLNPPRIPYLSNVTGTWITNDEAVDPSYWARHLRQPVRFAEALTEVAATSGRILLEVGPSKVLSDLARHTFPNIPVVTSLSSTDTGECALAKATASLACEGADVDWRAYYRNEKRNRLLLPTYPFERQAYWPNFSDDGETRQPLRLEARAPSENWLYLPTWKRANPTRLELTELLSPSVHWLVFSEDAGLVASMALRLRELGQQVTEVGYGPALDQGGKKVFTLNPRSLRDYESLLDTVPSDISLRIIHGWGLSAAKSMRDNRERFATGFDSLIRLSQALAGREFQDIQLTVLTANVQHIFNEEVSVAPRAAALGVVHVLPKETSNLSCRCVDIDDAEVGDRKWSIEALLKECASPLTDTIVAFRRGQRWVPLVESVDFPARVISHKLREEGVYIIMRGLQELGLGLAERLVQRYRARVIVVDRTYFPEPEAWRDWVSGATDEFISKKIVRLQTLHPQVRVVSTSLTDHERMRNIRQEVEHDFGPISGVFHLERVPAAGLIDGIADLPMESLLAHAEELAMLEKLFSDVELLALFSSNLAEGAGLGQVEQAARNAMSSMQAERLTRQGRRAVCIAWGTQQWRDAEAGNADGSLIGQQLEEKRRRFGMSIEECLDALEQSLDEGCSQVIVSTRDFNALMEQQQLFTAEFFQSQMEKTRSHPGSFGGNGHSRRALPHDYVAPCNEVEKLLVDVWKTTLGFAEIGITDNFFELGGHSLLAVQLLKKLNETFSTHLTLKDVFEAPTIAQLAHLISGPTDGDNDSDLDALLKEIEGMSEEAVKSALHANQNG